MIEEIVKNLWILLTIVIPGLFTYGTWRILLILEPIEAYSISQFEKIDASALLTTSIIIALALMQQAIAIVLELLLSILARLKKTKWKTFYFLFCGRFALDAAGKLNESITRIVGNYFLSVNISIGVGLLFVFYKFKVGFPLNHWIPISLIIAFAATSTSATFRMVNAMWAIRECNNQQVDSSLLPVTESLRSIYSFWTKQIVEKK